MNDSGIDNFRSEDGKRHLRGVALLVVFALAWLLLQSLVAGAQSEQVVTADPTSGLIDGQYVKVEWANYPADGLVYLRQCTRDPKSVEDCSEFLSNGITRADGTGVNYFRVRADVFVEEGFTCDYQDPCSIGVFTDDQDVASASFTQITFAFPPTSCPGGDSTFAAGSGASSINRAMLKWLAEVCLEPHSLSLSYAFKNSNEGRLDFIRGITDYGMTAAPATEEDIAEAESVHKGFTYVPLSVSGLAFAYNVTDRKTGERITDLKLNPDLLAELFTGQIANWNDPRIKALNPDHSLPSIVRAIGRADNSASTLLVTSWFDAVAKGSYEAGGPAYRGPTDLYPSAGDIELRTGADAVARELASPSQDSDLSQFGFIGWVDTSYAHLYGLPMVQVSNAAGEFVEPNPASLSAALSAAGPAETEPFLQPDFESSDPAVYPLLTVTNAFVPTGKIEPDRAKVVRSFLRYAATDGQAVLPEGYIPLDASLKAAARAGIDQIPVTKKSDPEEPGEQASGPAPAVDASFGTGSGVVVGSTPGDVEAPRQEPATVPAPVELEAEMVTMVAASDSRLILPVLVVLGVLAIVAGPALQLAARPDVIRASARRCRKRLANPFGRR